MKKNMVQNVQFHSNLRVLRGGNKKFDAVILDPKSTGKKSIFLIKKGTGRLKKNPALKLFFNESGINPFVRIQETTLRNSVEFVKEGGLLYYMTGSLLRQENQEQIRRFLHEHPQFKLLKENILLPNTHGYNGGYMAELQCSLI